MADYIYAMLGEDGVLHRIDPPVEQPRDVGAPMWEWLEEFGGSVGRRFTLDREPAVFRCPVHGNGAGLNPYSTHPLADLFEWLREHWGCWDSTEPAGPGTNADPPGCPWTADCDGTTCRVCAV